MLLSVQYKFINTSFIVFENNNLYSNSFSNEHRRILRYIHPTVASTKSIKRIFIFNICQPLLTFFSATTQQENSSNHPTMDLIKCVNLCVLTRHTDPYSLGLDNARVVMWRRTTGLHIETDIDIQL